VSSRKITDPVQALKTLDAVGTDRFHLLVDSECRAFRTFGCYKDGPLHGLFVIDFAGVIRARYTGEKPFDDMQAVADHVKSLANTSTRAGKP
jgi:peroxiredoxin